MCGQVCVSLSIAPSVRSVLSVTTEKYNGNKMFILWLLYGPFALNFCFRWHPVVPLGAQRIIPSNMPLNCTKDCQNRLCARAFIWVLIPDVTQFFFLSFSLPLPLVQIFARFARSRALGDGKSAFQQLTTTILSIFLSLCVFSFHLMFDTEIKCPLVSFEYGCGFPQCALLLIGDIETWKTKLEN